MNEREFQDALKELLDQVGGPHLDGDAALDPPDELADMRRISTFDEVGMLTNNAGLVVRMTDGQEFQITIVQSK